MVLLEPTQTVPLTMLEDGSIRVADSRVSLDSVLHHYQQGATVEEICLRFPGLRLADVHSALAYYLNHETALQRYLARREEQGEALQQQITTDPRQASALAQMRARLKERAASGLR
jgi:uncharacterized protein (DUF433 family)